MSSPREDSPLAAPFLVRSRHPRVLGAWQAGQAAARAYATRIREILDAAQAGHLAPTYGHDGRFTGLAAAPGDDLPPGWRHDGILAVPDPRAAAGRWVSAAIARETAPGDPRRRLPGLPAAVAGPEVLPGWRAELDGSGTALYAGWPPEDQGPRRDGQPDPRLWEPLSPAGACPRAATGGARR